MGVAFLCGDRARDLNAVLHVVAHLKTPYLRYCYLAFFAHTISGLRRNPLGSTEVREYSRFTHCTSNGFFFMGAVEKKSNAPHFTPIPV